ncbi:GumC family protein [Catenovulum maritimum]|uniref:Uncharacterized protein n=1 Tax=Catenovulum maritimum TaxID=1513271 RepID=A0A0J8GWB6_9ALTE|nr:polysaccharide biosynthesis tyrosine autokinase [Catenovulum maritimum]KMT65579.1 hypothetical protein XM47_07715 [Catenovulum maritimum]
MQQQKDDEIDLSQLFVLLWRRKWLPISLAFCFFAFAAIYAENATKKYSASTTIQVGIDQGNVVSIDELYILEARTKEHYNTQIELLKSRNMLARVVDKIGLTAQQLNYKPEPPILKYIPDLKPWLMPEIKHTVTQDLAIQLQSMMSVSQVSGSQLLNIKANASTPELAAKLANGLADVYMEFHRDSRQEVNDNAADWLVVELERLKVKLGDAEQDLQRFVKEEDLVEITGVLSLKNKDIETLAAQQLEASRRIDELKVQYLAIQDVTDPLLLLASSAIRPNSMVDATQQTLSGLKRKLAEISLVYGPKHPKRIGVVEEINSVQLTLKEQVNSLIKGVRTEYISAKENFEKLQSNFNAAKQELQQLSSSQNKYRRLQREVEANQELYDTFLKRLQETKATKSMQKSFARILDYAIPNNAHVSPKKSLIVVLAVLLGGMLGVVLIFLLEFKRTGIQTAEEACQVTGLNLLTQLPKIKRRKEMTGHIEHDELSTNPYYIEAMRALRTRLKVNHDSSKVIAITSAMPGEGKSSIALHLAKAFSELEKVLVIDADLHKPSMATKLGLLKTRPGLVELLSGQFKLISCLHRQKSLGYDVLCAGRECPNPTRLLLSPDFSKLLKALSKHYDRVIVETAPVNLVSDAQAISKAVDGVVFISRAETTPRGLIQNGIELLKQVDANILGLVMNQVNYKLARYQYRQYTNNPKPIIPVKTNDKVVALPPRYSEKEMANLKLRQQELMKQYEKIKVKK